MFHSTYSIVSLPFLEYDLEISSLRIPSTYLTGRDRRIGQE